MKRVRSIHIERLRIARGPILEQKDKEWMRAFGQGKTEEAARIEAERQALRDLPEIVAKELEKVHTPEEVARVRKDILS